MTKLSLADHFFNVNTAIALRPMLAFVRNQATLRQMLNMGAKMLYRALPGCRLAWMDIAGVKTLKIIPPGVRPDAHALLYLHGGGFTTGSPNTHKWLAARLAKAADKVVYLPKYALAPEQPYPAAHIQVEAVFDRLSQDGPVCVAGDSAGGQLAVCLIATGRPVQAAALISPLVTPRALHTDPKSDFSQERVLPKRWAKLVHSAMAVKDDPKDPRQRPLKFIPETPCPITVHYVEEEVLGTDARALLAAVPSAEGHSVTGVPHVYQLHAGWSALADQSVADMGAFLKAAG